MVNLSLPCFHLQYPQHFFNKTTNPPNLPLPSANVFWYNNKGGEFDKLMKLLRFYFPKEIRNVIIEMDAIDSRESQLITNALFKINHRVLAHLDLRVITINYRDLSRLMHCFSNVRV